LIGHCGSAIAVLAALAGTRNGTAQAISLPGS
jgi:hypothetical protein